MVTSTPWQPHAAGGRPLVCGHRGASAVEPENTVAAAVAAIDAGATWIEFDVRPSADGLVVHHDPATSDRVVIAETASDELDASIPTFEAFVAASGPLGLDIEMKTDGIGMPVERFVDLVADQVDAHCADRPDDRVIVTSFDMDALDRFCEVRPEIATGVLFHDRTGRWAIRRAVERGHNAIVPWFRLVDRRTVAAAHDAGLGVATWTVNSERHVRSMIKAGVDMIIGDDPASIRELVDEHADA